MSDSEAYFWLHHVPIALKVFAYIAIVVWLFVNLALVAALCINYVLVPVTNMLEPTL